MFKICETRSCYNYGKNQQYTFTHMRSNAVSLVFLLCDLDLDFRLQMFKICQIRPFHMSPEAKIVKTKSAIHIETFVIERHKYRVSHL